MRWGRGIRILALSALGIVGQLVTVQACGVRWDIPHSFFEGVDDDGSVLVSGKVDTLDLDRGWKLPVTYFFKSNWRSNSPFLGSGWMLPLLESRIVQQDEKRFQMWQPGGWMRTFHRSKDNPMLLNGGTWQAEIKGDTITAWAECGEKLVFSQGRLLSMTVKDRTLQFVYNNNRVSEIREDGVTKLKVVSDDKGNQALEFNGKRYLITLGDKPLIQQVNGKNLVAAMEKSLRTISREGLPASVVYTFGATAQLDPTLRYEKKELTWNPVSGQIISDGTWKYQVKPGEEKYAFAGILRTSLKGGGNESWFKDTDRGVETVEAADGTKTVTMDFVSGILEGKRRKQEVYNGGKLESSKSWVYDESGRMIRLITDGVVANCSYNAKGQLETLTDTAGKVLEKYEYNDQGVLIRKSDGSGRVIFEKVFKDGQLARRVIGGNMLLEYERKSDGSYREVQKDMKTGKEMRYWLYDAAGRQIEYTTLKGEICKTVYDQLGRKLQATRNGFLRKFYIYDSEKPGNYQEVSLLANGRMLDYVKFFKVDAEGVEQSVLRIASDLPPDERERILSILPKQGK